MSDLRLAQARDALSREPRRIAIIVAMEREIKPLLRRWREEGRHPVRRSISILNGYFVEGVWLITSGIGRRWAAVAARTIIEYYKPELIVSAGLAGALRKDLKPGAVLHPAAVYDASSGLKLGCVLGSGAHGVLVTADSVLSDSDKADFAARFHGDAVDMEAAVIAEVAHASGVPFVAVKAISDPVDLAMPPMEQFIDSGGRLHLLKLIGWALVRPRVWPVLAALRKNSEKAAEALATELDRMIRDRT